MERKIILYIAMTLDGYIADKDRSVAWLDKYNESGDDYGYKEFFAGINAVVVGNTTQKQFPQKYDGKPTYVFSHKRTGKDSNITYVSGNVKGFMKKSDPQGNIWLLGGSEIIGQFLKEGLIDEYIITVMPETLGGGIPLFQDGGVVKDLKLQNTKTYGNVVQLHYVK